MARLPCRNARYNPPRVVILITYQDLDAKPFLHAPRFQVGNCLLCCSNHDIRCDTRPNHVLDGTPPPVVTPYTASRFGFGLRHCFPFLPGDLEGLICDFEDRKSLFLDISLFRWEGVTIVTATLSRLPKGYARCEFRKRWHFGKRHCQEWAHPETVPYRGCTVWHCMIRWRYKTNV